MEPTTLAPTTSSTLADTDVANAPLPDNPLDALLTRLRRGDRRGKVRGAFGGKRRSNHVRGWKRAAKAGVRG